MKAKDWQPFILDALVIVAVTVLAALRVMPSEACIAVLSAIAGVRARENVTPKKDGSVAPSSSAVMLVLLGLWGIVAHRRSS